ncbi:MAG: ester cyclase, partial [Saprospiraceae bacterium]|nr:ester cyclase [Saprospiraceae bacterium]
MICACALYCLLSGNISFAQGDNARTLSDFFAAVDKGDFEKAGTYLSEDLMAILPLSSQPLDKAAYRDLGMGFKAGFPDMTHRFLETSESGNTVAAKGIFSGTNTGPLMGNPATGKRVEMPFLTYVNFNAAGKIAEINIQFNAGGFMEQLIAGMPMQEETNKKTVMQVSQALNKHDLDGVTAVFAPDCRFYGWGPQPVDQTGYKNMMTNLLAAFPDARFVTDDIIAEGEKVVIRHHLEGTHSGAAFWGTPATGREVNVSATVTYRFQNGKPAELWLNADFLGLLTQIGAIPPPQGK